MQYRISLNPGKAVLAITLSTCWGLAYFAGCSGANHAQLDKQAAGKQGFREACRRLQAVLQVGVNEDELRREVQQLNIAAQSDTEKQVVSIYLDSLKIFPYFNSKRSLLRGFYDRSGTLKVFISPYRDAGEKDLMCTEIIEVAKRHGLVQSVEKDNETGIEEFAIADNPVQVLWEKAASLADQ